MTNDHLKNGVILVSFEYPPRRLSVISDVVSRLANFLTKKGIKVWVVTFDDWRSDISVEKGVIINRIPNYIPDNISHFSTIMNLKSAYQSAIAAILNEQKVDIIHLFEWQTIPLLIPWGNKIDPKIVYSTSSIQMTRDNSQSPLNIGIQRVEEFSLSTVDSILTNSDQLLLNLIESYDLEATKVKSLKLRGQKTASKIYEHYKEVLAKK